MRFFSGLTEYRCLADLKVGVLGVGQIGKTVAKTFAGKRDKAKGRLKKYNRTVHFWSDLPHPQE